LQGFGTIPLAEHDVDRVIALKHGGQTAADNLASCCTVCNRFKGSEIASIDPVTGELTSLFHPRLDGWEGHCEFVFDTGEIVGLSAEGRVPVLLLNRSKNSSR
jgi:hypothetical protein